jgi:hypothetical protein
MQHPGLFSTQMAGIAGVFLVSQPVSELTGLINMARIHYIAEAAKHIRMELADTNVPPSDEALMSVPNLMAYSADPDQSVFPESHPISPLATAHNMDKFGKLTFVKTHHDVLRKLMARKGGLHNIKLSGLRDLLIVVDCLFATIEGAIPFLERPYVHQSLIDSGEFVPDTEALMLRSYLGRGFEECGLESDVLLEASRRAAEITLALDQHERTGGPAALMHAIVRVRDGSHHDLLALPSYVPPLTLLEKAWWYALLIDSDMVLWPTPSGKRVKSRLARQLRAVLTQAWFQQHWVHHQELLDWICFMGAIAASFTDNRAWYINLLRRRGRPELLKWQGLTKAMKRFLWWDPIFEMPAMQVWAELQDDT